jgi:hypothetical protein
MAAMHNVVVMGRAVTNVLQKLCSKVEDFDVWYQPWVEEMARDPLLRYLYNLRFNSAGGKRCAGLSAGA